MTTDYATTPASPLPLDTINPKSAYELMHTDSLPAQVKELIASVDSAISSHFSNGTIPSTIMEENEDEEQEEKFCKYHNTLINDSASPSDLRNMWILQRDISVQLFKMMMGLVRSASTLARQKRKSDRGGHTLLTDVDLELAFHGDARGAYQWLNCLARDECEWIWSALHSASESQSLVDHCPACLLGRAIQSESSIRLLIAAASLSNWDFFVTSLQQHLESDAWWGNGYWETIGPKAATLELQVRELLTQCAAIRNSVHPVRSHTIPTRRQNQLAQTISKQMKVDLDALHAYLRLQMPRRTGKGKMDLAKYKSRGSEEDEYRLAVYSWFALMLGISSETIGSHLSPVVRDLMWKSRVKTRSKTVTW